jgi:hypothetical protein
MAKQQGPPNCTGCLTETDFAFRPRIVQGKRRYAFLQFYATLCRAFPRGKVAIERRGCRGCRNR